MIPTATTQELATVLVALAAMVAVERLAPHVRRRPRPSAGDAPLHARLIAVPLAFAVAAVVAVLPTAALDELASVIGGPPAGPGDALLLVPLLAVHTCIFAGPFALPVLLALAAWNRNGVALHVVLGTLSTLPAMGAFALVFPGGLGPSIVGSILAGGALGGLAAQIARGAAERALVGLERRVRARIGGATARERLPIPAPRA